MVAQPPESAHRLCEQRSRKNEGNREPERVTGEEKCTLEDSAGRAREDEGRCQYWSDARGGTNGERASEQQPRASAPRALYEAGADKSLRPGQQAHEREPEDDEHEARDALEQKLVPEEPCSKELRPDPETHEHRGEPEHERDAREHNPASGAAFAKPFSLDGRHRRQIAGDERQDARGEE